MDGALTMLRNSIDLLGDPETTPPPPPPTQKYHGCGEIITPVLNVYIC